MRRRPIRAPRAPVLLALAAGLLSMAASGCGAQTSRDQTSRDQTSRAQTAGGDAAFGARVKAYILAHPEVIAEAMEQLQAQQAAEKAVETGSEIAEHRQALDRDPRDGVAGNPAGKVTVVEFFDYRCPFCKAADPSLAKLLQTNPNVRLVLKEFPILDLEDQTHISEDAARAALAAKSQGKYLEVHRALLAQPHLDDAGIKRVLTTAGVSPEVDAALASSPDITTQLAQNRDLARDIGVDGTPAFVVDGKLIAGAQLDDLQAAITAASKR